MRAIILFILLVITISIDAQNKNLYLTNGNINGKYWNEMGKNSKNEIILGVKAGISSSFYYLSQLKNETKDSLAILNIETIREAMRNCLWNSKTDIDQIRQEINNVYSLENRRNIPFNEVCYVILKFLSGDLTKSDKDYNIAVLLRLYNKEEVNHE